MNLTPWRKPAETEERSDKTLAFNDYVSLLSSFNFSGHNYTLPGSQQELIGGSYQSLARLGYKTNGIVFACMNIRMRLFSEARFQFQQLRTGGPGNLFGTSDLQLLESPWPGGTTGDLLARMIQHADLAGNAFVVRRNGHLACLRPDWVTLVGGIPGDGEASIWHPDAKVLGYVYQEGGPGSGRPRLTFLPEEIAHFCPIPDPETRFTGMSWLSPIIRELMADKAATEHKLKFFENGATPNLVVKLDVTDLKVFQDWIEQFKSDHEGVTNAYKTMFLAAGADAQVVGTNLQQLEFKVTQGAGETRIAAAAGVPPVIVGLSEGLQAATYSNYGQARRALGDGTMWPLWRNVAGSLEPIVNVPPGSRLWIDASGIPFLREDEKDAADIQNTQAQSIRLLVDSGYESGSVVDAVTSGDLSRLMHTGLFSVQLQPAGTTPKQGLLKGTPVLDPGKAKDVGQPASNGKNSERGELAALTTEG